MQFRVTFAYDAGAKVWYVEDSDVPGLHVEAATPNEMLAELRDILPELIRLNSSLIFGNGDPDVPIDLLYQYREQLSNAC